MERTTETNGKEANMVKTPKAKAAQQYTDMLTALFAQAEPKLYAIIRGSVQARAEYLLSKVLDGSAAKWSTWGGREYYDKQDARTLLTINEDACTAAIGNSIDGRHARYNYAAVDLWKQYGQVDSKAVDQMAKRDLQYAKESFIKKNAMKFTNAVPVEQVQGQIEANVQVNGNLFTGTITVTLANGKRVVASLDIKHVYRTTPRWTPYWQYPLTFWMDGKMVPEANLKAQLAGVL